MVEIRELGVLHEHLDYTGSIENWKFAIFKFGSESYDSQDWSFPGSDLVDGMVR